MQSMASQPPGGFIVLAVIADPIEKTAIASELAQRYTVITAGDGLEGLEAAARTEKIHLVVADLALKHIDGFRMARAMRRQADRATLPFVFLGANPNPRDAAEALAVGGRFLVEKPAHPGDVADRVAEVLARASQRPRW